MYRLPAMMADRGTADYVNMQDAIYRTLNERETAVGLYNTRQSENADLCRPMALELWRLLKAVGLWGAVAIGWSVTLLTAPANAAEAKRPNIVLIMCDDMGFSDIGCYGGEIDTPGIRFQRTNGIGGICGWRRTLR